MLRFRSFHDQESADDLAQWLADRGIPSIVKENSATTNIYLGESILTKSYEVQLPPDHFDRATEALTAWYATALDRVPKDYYLHDFSDGELLDILHKPDEWGELDYELAQALLTRRGHAVSDTELERLKMVRMMKLAQPQDIGKGPKASGWLVLLGYGLAFFGGFLGALVGWHIAHARNTLPDGTQVPVYTVEARKKGWWLFWTGTAITAILLGCLLFSEFPSKPRPGYGIPFRRW